MASAWRAGVPKNLKKTLDKYGQYDTLVVYLDRKGSTIAPIIPSLVPPTPDRSASGVRARKIDLIGRLDVAAQEWAEKGDFGRHDFFRDLADEAVADLAALPV